MVKNNEMEAIDAIIEDLLPLYNEGLLSEETTKWFEKQVQQNPAYQKLIDASQRPLPKQEIRSPIDQEQMMKKIHRKLSIYQMIFVALSFFLAINTSLLNESFGFILWYAVLGMISYIFYKDMKMVFFISFIPIFVWSIGGSLADLFAGNKLAEISLGEYLLGSLSGAFLIAVIHYLFAFIGSLVGRFIYKLKEKG